MTNVNARGSSWTVQGRLDHRVYTARREAWNGRLTKTGRQDVADSLNLTNLSEAVAGALASDVEYRLHQIIEVRTYYGTRCAVLTGSKGSSPFHASFATHYDDHLGH